MEDNREGPDQEHSLAVSRDYAGCVVIQKYVDSNGRIVGEMKLWLVNSWSN